MRSGTVAPLSMFRGRAQQPRHRGETRARRDSGPIDCRAPCHCHV